MFSKSFITLGLLTLFAYQGTTASQLSEIERATLGDLIKDVQEIISGLNQLVSGVIRDALKTLTNLISTVWSIKEEFLDNGLELISNGVGDVLVANKTARAAALGIDIQKCVTGTYQILVKLVGGLSVNLTGCVTKTVSRVLNTVNAEISNINSIFKTILAASIKLSKCLISLRPIICLINLLEDLKTMLVTLPGQVEEVTKLVEDLPLLLLSCVSNIGSSVSDKTQAMIKEIGNCVDDIFSKSTSGPSSTKASTTNVPLTGLSELINQVKEIIAGLEGLVKGVVADTVYSLNVLIDNVQQVNKTYLDNGLAFITREINAANELIMNKIELAISQGVDFSQCIQSTQKQVEALEKILNDYFTVCITTPTNKVLEMVIADISIVDNIASQVTGAPASLAKCLTSLKPIVCVKNLLDELTNLSVSAPGELKEIFNHVTELPLKLPDTLNKCFDNLAAETTVQLNKIVKEFEDCIDNLISGSS